LRLAERSGVRRETCVELFEVGSESGIMQDTLRYCSETAAPQETPAASASTVDES